MATAVLSWGGVVVPEKRDLGLPGADGPADDPVPSPPLSEDAPRPPAAEQVAAEAWVAPSWDEIVRTHSARVYRLA